MRYRVCRQQRFHNGCSKLADIFTSIGGSFDIYAIIIKNPELHRHSNFALYDESERKTAKGVYLQLYVS
jgi:hypothetical protein